MTEIWHPIDDFPEYSVSNYGRVKSDKFDRIMALSVNQFGSVFVGMMRDGLQRHRAVARLVAIEFLPPTYEPFDTPINLDGNRFNNHVDNLMWRPRWFAIKYHRQFREPYEYPIDRPIVNIADGSVSQNSLAAAIKYGLLEQEIVFAILNRTYVWPTYQEFQVAE
jgi:hypothetical protein